MKKRNAFNNLCLLLMLSVMIAIFVFSAQDGTESSEISNRFLLWLLSWSERFLPVAIASFIRTWIRKIAHFCIYMLLGFTAKGAFPYWRWFLNWLIPILYAVSDELHQYFVPGRACQLRDVMIDSTGALCGIFIFILFSFLITWIRRKHC